MKRLFSSLMIFSCSIFYPLLSMDKLVPISASPQQKTQKIITNFADLQKSFEEEKQLRSSPKDPRIKRNLQKITSKSRPYLEQLINQKDLNLSAIHNLFDTYQLFNGFITTQRTSQGYSKEQYQKDDILLADMYNALHSLFNMNAPSTTDLTQSTLCINSFQSSASVLAVLQKQRSEIEEQKKKVETDLVLIDRQIEFESLKQNFAKIELQKQTAAKAEQMDIEHKELGMLQQQIEQLTLELQSKKQHVATTENKHLQMKTLLVDDFLQV